MQNTVPPASSPDARARMTAQRRRDTQPELALRRELHRLGLRYRVHRRPLKGLRREADVVFLGARVAVFVDSCFWHCCPEHGTWPSANGDWWREKLIGNQRRDRDTDARLQSEGWTVARVWEHEEPREAAEKIRTIVTRRTCPTGASSSGSP
jgi:DNA mismatch endonuclease (patch repair protein)